MITGVDLGKITALAERLQGYGDVDYEVNELTIEENRALDIIVFECPVCNHWFHQRENANPDGEWICKECT